MARHFRKNQTPAEKTVWYALRNKRFKGLKFRRQHIIRGFIVDFFCRELHLAIEIDGGIHLKTQEYDDKRQQLIEETGIYFVRINNQDIFTSMNTLYTRIEEHMRLRSLGIR